MNKAENAALNMFSNLQPKVNNLVTKLLKEALSKMSVFSIEIT